MSRRNEKLDERRILPRDLPRDCRPPKTPNSASTPYYHDFYSCITVSFESEEMIRQTMMNKQKET